MKRQAPPLEAVEAFLIATRSPSFRAAADKLALSPSAFSRRIQTLEAFVGVSLFERDGRGVALTASGRRYLAEIEPAVDAIRRTTVNLRAHHIGGPLRIMTPQSFAIGWLLPHLPGFLEVCPDADPKISVGRNLTLLRKGLVDIAIHVGPVDGMTPGATLLTPIDGIVVAAPALARRLPSDLGIGSLADLPLLAPHKPEGMWHNWLVAVGHGDVEPRDMTFFTAMFMVYEAAAAGLGIALGQPLMMERFLAEGRLVPIFEPCAAVGYAYYIQFADDAVRLRPDARAFEMWLRAAILTSPGRTPSNASHPVR